MAEKKEPTDDKNRGLIDLGNLSFVNDYTYKEFAINPPNISADEYSKNALKALSDVAEKTLESSRKELVQGGFLASIEEVTHKFNRSGIAHTLRYLLADEGIYIGILKKVIAREKITDVSGMYSRVKANAREVEANFYAALIKNILDANNIDFNSISVKQLLSEVLLVKPTINNSEATVMELLNELEKLGKIPELIDFYFTKEEVDSSKATPAIRKAMAKYLLKIGLVIPENYRPDHGRESKFDEALFVAYTNALKRMGEGSDPINNLYSISSDESWDYVVDDFESTEGQGIDQESVKVASVLFYIKVLGDNMGIFKIVDSIIMSWTQGKLDIPQGESSQKLYKYYKLREERTTPEERSLFYGQVLNLGNTEMIDDMTVNEDFTKLWDVMMEESVNYIQKFETSESSDSISRMPIFRSIQDIQYNLSTHSSGMVKSMTKEMYAHLQSAIEILQEQAVVDQLGYGYNKSMWKVIEQVSRNEYNSIPNVSALKTVAVEGNKILRTIAEFDQAAVTDSEFSNLLNSCESFIIAQSQLGDMEENSEGDMEEMEETIDAADDDWDF